MVFPSKPSSSSQQQRSHLEDVDLGDDSADCTTMTDLSCDESTAAASDAIGVVVTTTTAMTSSENEHESSGGGASAGMGGVVMTTNGEKRALPMVVVDCKKSASMIVCDERITEKEDEQCGWGPFRPQCCQVFRNAKVVLFFLCVLATIQGMVINGFVSVVISTIEKRFHLASRESGFIASGYDIASVICLIPVSYFGGVGHRPRWIAAGVLLLSLGSFLFAMPHFITDFYTYGELQATDISTCASTWRPPLIANVNTSASEGADDGAPLDISSTAEHATSNLSGYMFVLVVAQMLHGVGGTPIYTLAVIYLHESLKPEVAPMYLGVFYTTAIIGPAIGYVLGGKLLEIYCDVGSVDMSKIDLTTSDPRWVGAWWIGFLVSGCLSFLVAIPLSAFPKMLPGSSQNKPVTVECEDDERVSVAEPGFRMGVREIPSSLKNLLCNQTFMALNLAGACEGMLISGFIVFTPKFVESQFSITAAWAAQLIGLVTIPSGGGGTFFGGYLVKRLNLRFCGILRLCLVTTGLVLCLTLTLLFRCENIPFVGVNVDYNNHSRLPSNVSLSSTCNTGCNCLSDLYDPVCGSDRLTYFSPCFAGCQSFDDINGLKMYYNCSCIGSPVQGAAVEGTCIADCQLLTMFLVVFACIIFVTFTTSMPALAATLRCVPDKQRSFALGIQWILFRTLGMIPAPILFGALIDNACIVWQKASSAGEKGACKFYDNWAMGTYLLGLIISCKILSFGFFSLALWRYRPLPGALGITSSTTDSGLSRSEKQPIAKSESNEQLDRTLGT